MTFLIKFSWVRLVWTANWRVQERHLEHPCLNVHPYHSSTQIYEIISDYIPISIFYIDYLIEIIEKTLFWTIKENCRQWKRHARLVLAGRTAVVNLFVIYNKAQSVIHLNHKNQFFNDTQKICNLTKGTPNFPKSSESLWNAFLKLWF